ncbi:hypothetical protein IV203_003580 [Nitzschia inconspicua]|uniref:Uncharacterized protein n=1 Tax=Nitzschia inconspicua TaxID=303405 RepID=A0A9K3PR38_9STRA|nr:hypothetical protein IV203_003580 [Nitzschia inconspicua]
MHDVHKFGGMCIDKYRGLLLAQDFCARRGRNTAMRSHKNALECTSFNGWKKGGKGRGKEGSINAGSSYNFVKKSISRGDQQRCYIEAFSHVGERTSGISKQVLVDILFAVPG